MNKLTNEEKNYLLDLAKRSLEAAVRGESLPEDSLENGNLTAVTGCFVTLHKEGKLRGCLGYVEGVLPLYKAIANNAVNAALKDHRFPNVKPEELCDISVEISVLSTPLAFEYTSIEDLLNQITPEVDGIILEKGGYRSTFLPQVWKQLPDKILFLEHLAQKAGLSKDDWRSASYRKYQAYHFAE